MATYLSSLETACLLFFLIGASAYKIPDQMNRIIGGTGVGWDYTYLDEFPYQLALEGAPNGKHICGGSVLNTHWAITAAHCVYNKPLKSLAFRAGSTVRGEGGTRHEVQFYLNHRLYRGDTLDYDLALVRVKVPFHYDDTVRSVLLPRRPPITKEAVTVSGWGFLEKEQLRKPKVLMSAVVEVISWDDCKKIYPNLTPRMMCAGAPHIDFCSGDSGGPLTRGNMEQIGVVSWLHKCDDGKPGVYANISSMIPWIESSLRKYGVYMNTMPATAMQLAFGTGFGSGEIIFPSM